MSAEAVLQQLAAALAGRPDSAGATVHDGLLIVRRPDGSAVCWRVVERGPSWFRLTSVRDRG
ncbi:MAG: hypothetical protein OXC12_15645 [Spirochaetaceae bacterium]|nr:hypothetical protein [Spirochaetaceae bacterium]